MTGPAAADDEEWVVRPVTGQAATKAYRCPGCDHLIAAGQPHVVVWPVAWVAGDPIELRRHWHTACWRRGPLGGRG
jgi:hypothetical protein